MNMDKAAYESFLGQAKRVSARLGDDIERIGPIGFPPRNYSSAADFLARAVVGQQLSVKASRTIWSRLEAACNARQGTMPDWFVAAHYDVIRASGVSNAKTLALFSIAEFHRQGALEPGKLMAMEAGVRGEHLRQIRGVGPWTCDMMAIFYFHDPDIWPRSDVAVLNSFAAYLDDGTDPDSVAARFRPWRSWLTLYLYRIVDGD